MNISWQDIQHVIFDWNGTLIDDLELAVKAVNHACYQYGKEPITRDFYRSHFQFPISNFYAAIGFDVENAAFPEIVRTYLSLFDTQVKHCTLHAGSAELIKTLRAHGIGISILSASHHTILQETIRAKGLHHDLSHVCGLTDEHAASKLQQAIQLQQQLAMPARHILYVGDTSHDAEIADTMGWRAVMLRCGHQNDTQLAKFAYPRLNNVAALRDSFAEHIR